MDSPTAMPVDSTLGFNGGDDSMATVTNEMGALSTEEGVSRKVVVWDAKAAERATSLASIEMENTPAKGASGFYMVGNATRVDEKRSRRDAMTMKTRPGFPGKLTSTEPTNDTSNDYYQDESNPSSKRDYEEVTPSAPAPDMDSLMWCVTALPPPLPAPSVLACRPQQSARSPSGGRSLFPPDTSNWTDPGVAANDAAMVQRLSTVPKRGDGLRNKKQVGRGCQDSEPGRLRPHGGCGGAESSPRAARWPVGTGVPPGGLGARRCARLAAVFAPEAGWVAPGNGRSPFCTWQRLDHRYSSVIAVAGEFAVDPQPGATAEATRRQVRRSHQPASLAIAAAVSALPQRFPAKKRAAEKQAGGGIDVRSDVWQIANASYPELMEIIVNCGDLPLVDQMSAASGLAHFHLGEPPLTTYEAFWDDVRPGPEAIRKSLSSTEGPTLQEIATSKSPSQFPLSEVPVSGGWDNHGGRERASRREADASGVELMETPPPFVPQNKFVNGNEVMRFSMPASNMPETGVSGTMAACEGDRAGATAAAAAPIKTLKIYYYFANRLNECVGPFPAEQMSSWYSEGYFSPKDQVACVRVSCVAVIPGQPVGCPWVVPPREMRRIMDLWAQGMEFKVLPLYLAMDEGALEEGQYLQWRNSNIEYVNSYAYQAAMWPCASGKCAPTTGYLPE